MMIAQASVLCSASLDQVRDAVLDPEAYLDGATKVQDLEVESREGNQMVARIGGHLGPFNSSIRARYLIGDSQVDLTMLEGKLRGFHAVFLLDPGPQGVVLTHREEYDFGYPLISPLLDKLLLGWASRSVIAEVTAIKHSAEKRSGQAA